MLQWWNTASSCCSNGQLENVKAIVDVHWCVISLLSTLFLSFHYYRIHHRKHLITAGLVWTGGIRLSPPVLVGTGSDTRVSPPVRNTTRRWCLTRHHRRVVTRPDGDASSSPPVRVRTRRWCLSHFFSLPIPLPVPLLSLDFFMSPYPLPPPMPPRTWACMI